MPGRLVDNSWIMDPASQSCGCPDLFVRRLAPNLVVRFVTTCEAWEQVPRPGNHREVGGAMPAAEAGAPAPPPLPPSRLRRASAAAAWSLVGFLAGAVFWHFVGFWSFLGAIVLKGPEHAARGERPSPTEVARSARRVSDAEVPASPAIGAGTGESCVELAINRALGTTSRRACPAQWISGDLVETAYGKDDREVPEAVEPVAGDAWSATISTGSIKP